jgi:asparagine synthetase B (glutamine-hydrolysing)
MRFNLLFVNYLMRLRGPDVTVHRVVENFHLVHNLLHITGNRTTQPFTHTSPDGALEVACLFNGEIYNYQQLGITLGKGENAYGSDGECLIDLYRAQGPSFVRSLHGEFALAVFDFKKRVGFLARSQAFFD